MRKVIIEGAGVSIKEELGKFFRSHLKDEPNDRPISGKIPISSISKVISDAGREDLKEQIMRKKRSKFSSTQLRLFALGHLLEEYIVKELEADSNQFKLNNKQALLENDILKGMIDFTLTDSAGRKYICDVKTMNDMNYHLLINGIVPEYIKAQLMTYAWLWRETINEEIESDTIILAYNKNDSRVAQHVVKYDAAFLETYLIAARRFVKQLIN